MNTALALCPQVDCPAPSHDTPSAFRRGCRSEAAVVAERRRAKQNRTGHWQPRRIDNTGTVRRLQALAVMGWSSTELGTRLGTSNSAVNQLRYGRHDANVTSAAKVAALYDELGMIPGGDRRTMLDAKRKGWFGPLCWDEGEIDDPRARPKRGTNKPGIGRRDPAEVRTEVLRLDRGDLTIAEIAETVGVHRRTVERIRVEQAGQVAA